MKEISRRGKVWILTNKKGKLIENIDTDQIYHNEFLHITELSQMGQYALGNLEGWKDFSAKADPGDVIVAGRNFGAGSSRQQAVDCFISLKINMILAPSFGAIYFRNAVNSGFPVLKCPLMEQFIESDDIRQGNSIEVNFRTGEARNETNNSHFAVEPMSQVQFDIYQAGGLFNYGRKIKEDQS
ncbi:MAG: 3-isopropylmalate dehydratase [Candidatus Aminicenantaceae bacterium]